MFDTSNYRPVAVATVVSKLLEHFILSNISPFLGTTDNQFGFKAGHSTDQCTFLLKQTSSYFVTHGSSVHAVFLDASKAFDRVLHMKLFEKLIQRKVPMCFVRLLKHWYKEQTMQIKWGKHFSEPFRVSNGVRQGWVLSPYLFAVHLDDLSNELNNIKAGCYIGEVLLNHLMFADDIWVLVATRFNVTCFPLRLCYEKTRSCFSKDAEFPTTYGYVLWCSQIVCTRHYSLNTIIAFYSVNVWSNFAVSLWSMACHATMLSHFTQTRPI